MTTTESRSTKQEILEYLLRQGRATAQELAKALAISPQATRRHLKDLEGDRLIDHSTVQVGMGRPNHVYELSAHGKSHFPQRYSEFAISFLDTVAETVGKEQLEEVLRKQWHRKALSYRHSLGEGNLESRVSKLVSLRQEEGYMAELLPTEKTGEFIFAEHNCAIAEVAESFPTVCGNELEMFAEILPDCQVERIQWINGGEHRCGYLITQK